MSHWNVVCNTNTHHVLKYCYDISLNNIYTKTIGLHKNRMLRYRVRETGRIFYVAGFPVMSNRNIVCNAAFGRPVGNSKLITLVCGRIYNADMGYAKTQYNDINSNINV